MNDVVEMAFAAGGLRFAALAAGDGDLVLLLHGFPDTKASFATQLPALAAAGYRAVAPTMRGYTPEALAADGDYHAVRMAEDVLAIADAAGARRFHLIGHDWGATIGFAVVGMAPDRVASFAALAVPHPVRFGEAYAADPTQQARSAYILAFQSPDAEAMIAADDLAYLERLWRAWSPGWDIPAAALAEMRATFAAPGVLSAALGYYRQAFDAASPAGQATQRALAGPFAVPTLGICGAEDGCIGADIFAAAMRAEDFTAGLAVHTIAGAGHFLHQEAPDRVNPLLIDWLHRHPV